MSSSQVLTTPIEDRSAATRSFLLVFACTVIGALAQLFLKAGAAQMGAHVTLLDVVHDPTLIFRYSFGIISNPSLFCGYALYGVNTILLALALKGRELSKLYPIIALTYVWVTLLSVFVLHEHINFFRIAGIAAIVFGVSILGMKRVP